VIEAEVVEVDNEFVRVGTEKAGMLTTSFRKEMIKKVEGKTRPFQIPNVSVSFVKACRQETSYSLKKQASKTAEVDFVESGLSDTEAEKLFCNCRKGNTNQCKEKKTCACFRGGLKCRSDCHKGKAVCDLAEINGRKRPHLDPLDSSDDLSDFESSPNTLLAKQKQRELKRQKKIAEQYPFKTIADRYKYYMPAFKTSMSEECFDYLYNITWGEIDSEFNFCWINGLGAKKRTRFWGENAHPLTDGDYLERLTDQLQKWWMSLSSEAEDNLKEEAISYIWAVWLPEAVKFGLFHGLKMKGTQACLALSAKTLFSQEEIEGIRVRLSL
jgi:hypothetical protein